MQTTKTAPSTESYTIFIPKASIKAEVTLPKAPDTITTVDNRSFYVGGKATKSLTGNEASLRISQDPYDVAIGLVNAMPVPGHHAEDDSLNPLGFKLRDAIIKKIKVQVNGYFSMYKMPLANNKDQKTIDAFYENNPGLTVFTPVIGEYRDIFFPELGKANISSDKDVPYDDQLALFFPQMKKSDWKELCICMLCELIKTKADEDFKSKIQSNTPQKIDAYNKKLEGNNQQSFFNFYQRLMGEWLIAEEVLLESDDKKYFLDLYLKILMSNTFVTQYRLSYDRGTFVADWFWFHSWLKLVMLGATPENIAQVYNTLSSQGVYIPDSVSPNTWRSYNQWLYMTERPTDEDNNRFFVAGDIDTVASMQFGIKGVSVSIARTVGYQGKKTTNNIYAKLFFGGIFKASFSDGQPYHNDAPGKGFSSINQGSKHTNSLLQPSNPLENFSEAYGELITTSYEMEQAVAHPKQTAENTGKDIANAVTHPDKTAEDVGKDIVNTPKQTVEDTSKDIVNTGKDITNTVKHPKKKAKRLG
ncbi:hypothetical protein [Microscilla marina]|uniref:Uncharacterized protein n=1 Tax=Microscilla marina ATCC 23134 TaxID=313606 RepID=A1ZUM4_MICM2|nr:hypothetical protein [Microscilla marina]EAY25910.1 hypothetical protein M23134_00864 [Microscilla marina ATCC 23134]